MDTHHHTPEPDSPDVPPTSEPEKPPRLRLPSQKVAEPAQASPAQTTPTPAPPPAQKSPLGDIDTVRAVKSPDVSEDKRISETFQRSLKKSTNQKRDTLFKSSGKRATFDIQLDRHEAKYIVPIGILPAVRKFIKPFCEPDPHGHGDPPQYTVTTLQLDAPNLALHHAKYQESLNRFKLRVRTYGTPGDSKVFLEVKRKIRGTIVKSRTSIPFEAWGRELLYDTRLALDFRSSKEVEGYLDFARLTREIGGEPKIWIQYVRESYFSRMDSYARVSFDTKLCYQPADDWLSWGRNRNWIHLDSTLDQDKQLNFSGVILELKTLSDTPRWMIDLVMHFDLVRCGNCKYSSGIWAESVFRGSPEIPLYAIEILDF